MARDHHDDAFADLADLPDPFGLVYRIVVRRGRIGRYTVSELPAGAVSNGEPSLDVDWSRPSERPHEVDRRTAKLHPLVRRRMGEGDPDARERVVIVYRDDLRIPRFPEPELDEPRDSPTNRSRIERADALVDAIRARRADDYARISAALQEQSIEIVETFWLIRAVVAVRPN